MLRQSELSSGPRGSATSSQAFWHQPLANSATRSEPRAKSRKEAELGSAAVGPIKVARGYTSHCPRSPCCDRNTRAAVFGALDSRCDHKVFRIRLSGEKPGWKNGA